MRMGWGATAIAAFACAACANDTSTPSGLGGAAGAMHLLPSAAAAEAKAPELRKTYASRVLSAIALEKVTGRKPDPQRLMELD
jgi:hypothetical protein